MKPILRILLLACLVLATGCGTSFDTRLANAEAKGIAIVKSIDTTVESGANIAGVLAKGVGQGAADVAKATTNATGNTLAATINQIATTTANGAGVASTVSNAIGSFATGFGTALPPVPAQPVAYYFNDLSPLATTAVVSNQIAIH